MAAVAWSGAFSCTKCPPPLIVVWGSPCAPGTVWRNWASPPALTGSLSTKAQRNGLSKLGEELPGVALGVQGRVGRERGDLARHGARSHLVARIREGRVVGPGHVRGERRPQAQPVEQEPRGPGEVGPLSQRHRQHEADGHVFRFPAELLPVGELRHRTPGHLAQRLLHLGQGGRGGLRPESLHFRDHFVGKVRVVRQAGVGDHDAIEPVRVVHDHAQPDEPAPVLAEERDPGEVVPLEPASHPVDLPLVAVVLEGGGLVGLAVAGQVRRDHPHPFPDEQGDHLPVEVAPDRLTVHAQHEGAVRRTLVDVVNAQVAAVVGANGRVVGLERVAGQVRETRLGRSQYFHDGSFPGRLTFEYHLR